MPKRKDIKTILVIGSGPIIIGQAAEFDYAGTQACLSLREEGYEVILVNSNPATIMTDKEIADKVYIEPLTVEFLSKIIRKEKPDALLPTLGGQVALNLAVSLHESGILDECGVEILGTKLTSIKQAEDRELFRDLMNELNEPVPDSAIVHTLEEAEKFVKEIGYPVIVRPAFTMGGTGGGICYNDEDLEEIVPNGLNYSPVHQCLLEKSIAGYKEIEYEVMRDNNDTAIVVCNMENIDPVGIHTGDSIVVAPCLTLTDRENHMLRDVSLKIIRALKIEGGCNVQIALDPNSFKYYIIEVNPRVSRSSALASKATGYPIAKIAAKIAVGMTLDEIINPVTNSSYACFEPAIDYVVTKIPRFPFDKFGDGDRYLGTQMKATGEVMAIGRTLEESLLKAIRSLEYGVHHLGLPNGEEFSLEKIIKRIKLAGDERLFFIGEALRRICEGAKMIRTKGEAGTGDVVQAVSHMRQIMKEINLVKALREDELYVMAKDLQVPYDLVKYVHDNGRLPVPNFSAGGVATPADAALMRRLGADGVFVGSGIFKSGNPKKRAKAIVEAVKNYNNPEIIAKVSEDLGEAMVGINENEIKIIMAERGV